MKDSDKYRQCIRYMYLTELHDLAISDKTDKDGFAVLTNNYQLKRSNRYAHNIKKQLGLTEFNVCEKIRKLTMHTLTIEYKRLWKNESNVLIM